MENLQNIAATTTVDVMSFDYITPPVEVAAQLGLAGDALTQRVERRRNRDGEPFSYILTYVPEAIGRSWDEATLTARPILQIDRRCGPPHSVCAPARDSRARQRACRTNAQAAGWSALA